MKPFLPLLFVLLAAGPAPGSSAEAIDYRFDAVKRNVTLLASGQSGKPASAGLIAHSGDRVQTGWFSSALIAAEKYRAKFEIFSATDVTLTDGTPGVILSVERGRIRAAFDKIVGNEPRIVKTPGALLAVRGTQFDVEVDAGGETVVSVFEGVVEVQSPLRPEPLLVRPGEQSVFGRRTPPRVAPMSDERRRRAPEGTIDRGPMNRPDHGMPERPEGMRPGGQPGMTPPTGTGPGGMMPGGHGQPQPQKPPRG